MSLFTITSTILRKQEWHWETQMESSQKLATQVSEFLKKGTASKLKKKIGTPIHQQKALQSHTFFNSTRAGFCTPIRLRKKSPNSPFSSPSQSPNSPFSSPSQSPKSPFSSTASTGKKTPFTKFFKDNYSTSVEKHLNAKFNKTTL